MNAGFLFFSQHDLIWDMKLSNFRDSRFYRLPLTYVLEYKLSDLLFNQTVLKRRI